DLAFLLRWTLLLSFLNFCEDRFHLVVEVSCSSFCVLRRQIATTDEVFGVGLANTAVVVDFVVENRLGHGRIISLIVTAQAVAQQVNEDIRADATTVLGRQRDVPYNCFWVINVDVEDRAVKDLSQVGGVVGRAGRIWSGGETILVVDHNVYGTAGGVATQ